jgi:hypothetical protein
MKYDDYTWRGFNWHMARDAVILYCTVAHSYPKGSSANGLVGQVKHRAAKHGIAKVRFFNVFRVKAGCELVLARGVLMSPKLCWPILALPSQFLHCPGLALRLVALADLSWDDILSEHAHTTSRHHAFYYTHSKHSVLYLDMHYFYTYYNNIYRYIIIYMQCIRMYFCWIRFQGLLPYPSLFEKCQARFASDRIRLNGVWISNPVQILTTSLTAASWLQL